MRDRLIGNDRTIVIAYAPHISIVQLLMRILQETGAELTYPKKRYMRKFHLPLCSAPSEQTLTTATTRECREGQPTCCELAYTRDARPTRTSWAHDNARLWRQHYRHVEIAGAGTRHGWLAVDVTLCQCSVVVLKGEHYRFEQKQRKFVSEKSIKISAETTEKKNPI